MKKLTTLCLTTTLAFAFVLGGCEDKKKKEESEDKLAESIGNSLVLGMAKSQFQKAKEKFDKGEDATTSCIMDTSELRKDSGEEAQKLANDIDQLCEADAPAKKLTKELESRLADVEKAREGKDKMLASRVFMLKSGCEDTDKRVAKLKEKKLDGSETVKALIAAKEKACTEENLGKDEGAKETAANK